MHGVSLKERVRRKIRDPGFGLFIPKKPSQNHRVLSASPVLALGAGSSPQTSSRASLRGTGSVPMMEAK